MNKKLAMKNQLLTNKTILGRENDLRIWEASHQIVLISMLSQKSTKISIVDNSQSKISRHIMKKPIILPQILSQKSLITDLKIQILFKESTITKLKIEIVGRRTIQGIQRFSTRICRMWQVEEAYTHLRFPKVMVRPIHQLRNPRPTNIIRRTVTKDKLLLGQRIESQLPIPKLTREVALLQKEIHHCARMYTSPSKLVQQWGLKIREQCHKVKLETCLL